MACLCNNECYEKYLQNRRIEKFIRKEKRRQRQEIRLLLLGSRETGKSTIMKQMKIIHGENLIDAHSIEHIRHVIYQNILKGFKVLIDARDKLAIQWQYPDTNAQTAEHVLKADTKSTITPEYFGSYVSLIETLWKDEAIQKTFQRRNLFQLSDGFHYLFNNLDRISFSHYVPTNLDILHARIPTTTINEYCVTINKVPFIFIDVGGQRNQKSKWFQSMDNVTSILFIVSSIEYDQFVVEDRSKNRLQESLDIFVDILNSDTFKQASIIIFLNKTDLLAEKLCQIRERKKRKFTIKEFDLELEDTIDRHFVNFVGDATDLNQVQNFMLLLFKSKCETRKSTTLYTHFTTAIDTENIKHVFNDVRNSILQKNISQIMLQ